MIGFVPFRAEHFADIGAIRESCSLGPTSVAEQAVAIERCGGALSCTVDGRVTGCAGVFDLGGGRAYGWAAFGVSMPLRAFPAVTRKTVEVLDDAHRRGFGRIETYVRTEFAAGVRWALRLGFANPFPMRKFSEGADYWMMERVR